MTITRRGAVSLVLLVLTIAVGWTAYAPAVGGALLFDDTWNLQGLAHVEDRLSALLFIFSGEAGPLGRPIALATFAAQADSWGSEAAPFLRVNILIHLANGCLLFWVLCGLSRWTGVPDDRRWVLAIAVTAIWLFMPLLASSSLMVIQRMTTLSASFVLLSIGGYLHARARLEQAPRRSLAMMSACITLGTIIAVLTKENGALLPVYVLVLELTILPRPNVGPRWQVWKTVFLVLPTILVLGFLASRVPYSQELVLKRDFTGWERLLTESRILWEYLFNAFFPQPGEFGPFHDGYDPVKTILNPATMAAVAGWTTLLALALAWRRDYSLFAFAVLWFLGGHVLESTVIPLELYFEHRNYLPIAGPIFAACAVLVKLSPARRKVAYAGLSMYAVLNALVLFTHSTLWGEPQAAAQYWADRFPRSVRAATTAAGYRSSNEGLQGTLEGLHRVASRNPDAGFVKVPELTLTCLTSPDADHSRRVADLHRALETTSFNYTVATMLFELFSTVTSVDCNGVDARTVRALAVSLLSNPRYRTDSKYNNLHHQLMARIARHEGNYNDTLLHLHEAREIRPSSDLNTMIVMTFADGGDFEAARAFIEKARKQAPWLPMKRFVWMTWLDRLSSYTEELSSQRHSHE